MAKVLEALIAKGRRVRRPREQKEVAFGLCDLSTHGAHPRSSLSPPLSRARRAQRSCTNAS